MNIRQIQSFVSVIERGSFAAAADALVTTQSTISARIRELERHLGVDLFDRTQHRARLTPKGEQMLLYARQMLDLSNQIDREVGDPGSIGGTIRIGAVGMVVRHLMPRLVSEVRRRFPNLRIKLHVHLARTLLDMLEDAENDLALVNAPAAIDDVETLTIGRDRFVWMAAHELGVPHETLTPKQLLSWPILGFPEESHHFPITNKWFAADNAVYAPAIASSDMDVLAALACDGAGIALLAQGCYANLIEQGRLRVLDVQPAIPPASFAAIYKRNALIHPLVPTIASLAAEMSEQLTGLTGDRKLPRLSDSD